MNKVYAAVVVAVMVGCFMLNLGEPMGSAIVAVSAIGAWMEA